MFDRCWAVLATAGLVTALLSAPPASAATITYTAVLDGAQEALPNASTGFGLALLTFDDGSDLLTVNESFTGLSSVAAAAHLHCCGAPGTSAIVAIPFPVGPFDFPIATSGSFNQTFNLLDASIYTNSFFVAHGAVVADAEAALIAGLNAGTAYVNIHDSTFPGGEIRGNLAVAPAAAVPEPATLGLLSLGLGSVAARRRARRHDGREAKRSSF